MSSHNKRNSMVTSQNEGNHHKNSRNKINSEMSEETEQLFKINTLTEITYV